MRPVVSTLTLGQLRFTPGRLAQYGRAIPALNDGRGMGEDGSKNDVNSDLRHMDAFHKRHTAIVESSRDLETSRALDVHEKRSGFGNNLLELVGTVDLVLRGIEDIDGESLEDEVSG